jgi:hypothetical protein
MRPAFSVPKHALGERRCLIIGWAIAPFAASVDCFVASPPSVEYALTALGRELLPAIEAIVDVSRRLQRSGVAHPGRKTRMACMPPVSRF